MYFKTLFTCPIFRQPFIRGRRQPLFVFLVPVLLILSLGLAACGGSSTTQAQPTPNLNAPVTISVGNWPAASDPTYATEQAHLQSFEKLHPNVTIKPSQLSIFVNDGVAAFYAAAQAKQLPNVYYVPFTEPNKIMDGGYSADITSALSELGLSGTIKQQYLSLMQRDGKTYGLPVSAYTMGLFVNIPLFKQAGLVNADGTPQCPQTYSDLAHDALLIKQKAGQAGFFFPTENNTGGWESINLVRAFGGDFEQQANGKWTAVFNSPQAVQALQLLKDMRWKDNSLEQNILQDPFSTSVSGLKLFGTNQVGMMFGTPDWFSLLTPYHFAPANMAMCQLPAGPTGVRSAVTGGTIVAFAPQSTPEQIQWGIKWFEFDKGWGTQADSATLSAYESNLQSNLKIGQITGITDPPVFSSIQPIVQAEDKLDAKYRNVDRKLFADYLDNAAANIHPEPPISAQQLYHILDGVIQAILTNANADPQALLNKATQNFQSSVLDNAQ